MIGVTHMLMLRKLQHLNSATHVTTYDTCPLHRA